MKRGIGMKCGIIGTGEDVITFFSLDNSMQIANGFSVCNNHMFSLLLIYLRLCLMDHMHVWQPSVG